MTSDAKKSGSPIAKSFEELLRNVALSKGDVRDAIVDGWKFSYSDDVFFGKHMAASRIIPSAGEDPIERARIAMRVPEDAFFHVSVNGVRHWAWDRTIQDGPSGPEGYAVEVIGDPVRPMPLKWGYAALVAAQAAADKLIELGLSPSGGHFKTTAPDGTSYCVHFFKDGEAKPPRHDLH